MKKLNDIESAWLGALIEGEGSIQLCRNRRNYGQKVYYYPQIAISNTEVETIATCLRFCGEGNVFLRKAYHSEFNARKLQWVFSMAGWKRCIPVLESIAPYLTGKQDRALGILEQNKNRPLIEKELMPRGNKGIGAQREEVYKNGVL